MAVINSIRKRSGLLIGTIGVAMVLFIGGELFSGNNMFNKQDTTVGEIAGDKIEYADFEAMVRKIGGDQTLTPEQMNDARNRAWNRFIQNKVLFKEYEKLGLSVAPEELFDQIKNNEQNKVLNQFFTNPQTNLLYEQFQNPATGRLDNNRVLAYVKNVMAGDQKDSWLPIEEAIRLDMLSNKYTQLIKEGLAGSSFAAKIQNSEENQRINLSWTGMNYSEISDDEVVIDESDLKSYYNKHKNEKDFEQEETMRGAKLAIFSVTPSPKDFDDSRIAIENQMSAFNSAANDTLFVYQNSDDPQRSFKLIGRYDLPVELDSMVFSAPIDSVFGPYLLQNGYNISKKTGVQFVADSVNARHVLLTLKPESDTSLLQSLADSIKAQLEKGADFAAMATEFSQDFGSAQNGGSLDWFTQGKMVQEFNDICFDSKTRKGDIVIVTTQFGIHIIDITDKTKEKEKIQIANIVRYVGPSAETFDEAYNKASAFSINNSTLEAFETALSDNETIESLDYSTIKEGDKVLGSLENPRTIIRWAYDNEVGKVSEPFEMGNKFVVASVTSIKDKGILPLSEVEDLVREGVMNEKKSQIILAKLGSFATIEDAAKNAEKEIQAANDISFNMFSITGIGPENKVLGIAFGLPQGATSEAIIGENGVYVIRLDVIGEPAESSDLTFVQDQIKRNYGTRVDVEVFEALKQSANITDSRTKFY
ncbi:MAG: peptidylprolyl isomerase [Salibacteraceae bacterium]|nr:peptidylprolyl isomerase [Salibacteraceae bacterium]|tara:strand:+ start:22663 stop:24777 length:2115 start_codon:yes stop_codon:yes gene_type:complete